MYLANSLPSPNSNYHWFNQLSNLRGEIYGIDDKERTESKAQRVLTKAPVIGKLCLTYFYRHYLTDTPDGQQLEIEGRGRLYIPDLGLKQKYTNLFSENEYFKKNTHNVANDDSVSFTLDEAAHCWRFTVSVDPRSPTI